jgi:hypothetical protein
VCQGNFGPRSWGCLGGRFEGDWMVSGVEVRRVRVHILGGARRGFLRLILANRYLPPPYFPSFLTAEGKPPRGSRGPDKGDRRSWRVGI